MTAGALAARRPPRAPGVAFGAFTTVLFVLIAVVALTSRPASPPSVAELAPQATQQLHEDALDDRDGVGGEGGEGGTGGAGADGGGEDGAPPEDEDVVDSESVRRCIGTPPRQIEDPQSPPCVPYFKGDNGGATWKGVTENEIVVAVGNMIDSTTGAPVLDPQAIRMYQDFFNRRFEFYGRQLRLVPFTPARPAAPPSEMVNDAIRVDEEIGAFAGVMYSEQDGLQYVYFDALAERQIMGVLTGILGISRADEEHLRAHAPYQWDYVMSVDRMLRGYGEFICAQLAGKPPVYAGTFRWSPSGPPPQRKFGLIQSTEFGGVPFDIEPLRAEMAKCDTPLEVLYYDGSAQGAVVVSNLQDKEITDVMYTGQSGILALRLMNAAQAQGYYPEWLVSNMGYQDSDASALYFPASQQPHVIGLQVYNKTVRPEDQPFQWALKEMDPAAAANFDGEHYLRLYSSLLVLASGIQMAGPELTPERFEAGLMKARFPNPGAGAAPYYQARVGFPGIHTMVQDLTPVWLSSSERAPSTGRPPTYCYVDLGKRYAIGQWPRRDPAFHQDARGPCR